MRQGAVGQKCPNCARVPRSARALGRPVHYVKGVAAGLGAAAVGGVLYGTVLALVPFGSLILAGLLGYGVGAAVSWGVARQSQPPFPVIAASCAVIGVAAGFVTIGGTPLPRGLFGLLAYAAAGFFALRGLRR